MKTSGTGAVPGSSRGTRSKRQGPSGVVRKGAVILLASLVALLVIPLAAAAADDCSGQVPLAPGWNLVSVPKKLAAGQDTGSIFAAVDTAGRSAWLFDGVNKTFAALGPGTKVRPLDGIFLYSKSAATVPLVYACDPLQIPPVKQGYQGWNSFGFTGTTPATARDTLFSVQSVWVNAVGFNATSQQYGTSIVNGGSGEYSDSRLMEPMKGYWLYLSGPGEIAAIGA